MNDEAHALPSARPALRTLGPQLSAARSDHGVTWFGAGVAGFERFAQGQLITLFSATNYCGTANNAGAILVLGRDLTLYPKLIHPLPPAILEEGEEQRDSMKEDTWMQSINRDRPPTPPRGRQARARLHAAPNACG